MPIIMRRIFGFTRPLSALCAIAALCVASLSGAGPQPKPADGAPAVKKKIALAQFDVVNTLHVDDIHNIYDGLPMLLGSNLEATGEFLAVYTGRSIPLEAGEVQRSAIAHVAGESGAQFLISGVVVNAGVRKEDGFLGTSLNEKIIRHAEVELSVYDGRTGARLLLRRLNEQAQDETRVGNDKPFGSSLFLETQFGQAIMRLADAAVEDIRATLENIPFSANVVTAAGNRIVIDAGSDSLLKPGDRLVVYPGDATPATGLKGVMPRGAHLAADLATLTEVRQQYSSAELSADAAKQGVRAGSIASIDADVQRQLLARQIAEQQRLKAEEDARAEAARLKAEQAAQAEAARIKAEQDAKAEAARIKAEKKAKAQAATEAKKKAAQQASAARISAAQKARDRAAKVRTANEARAVKPKAAQETECPDPEKEARADVARIKAENKARVEAEYKAAAEAQAAGSGVVQAGTGAKKETPVEPADTKKKLGVPLKLTPIKPQEPVK